MPLTAVRVFDVQPELLDAVPVAEREEARRLLVIPALEVAPGELDLELTCSMGSDRHGFGLLIVSGVIVRSATVRDRTSIDVLGGGEILVAGGDAPDAGRIDYAVREDAVAAVLDDRILIAARRWPRLTLALLRRMQAQLERAGIRQAAGQLPRVEHRVLAVFADLAARWGRVTPQGVVVPLSLTHDALGRLAGAARPTVTLALGALAQEGALVRRAEGGWILRDLEALPATPEPAPAPPHGDIRLVAVEDAEAHPPLAGELRARVAAAAAAHEEARARHATMLAACERRRAAQASRPPALRTPA